MLRTTRRHLGFERERPFWCREQFSFGFICQKWFREYWMCQNVSECQEKCFSACATPIVKCFFTRRIPNALAHNYSAKKLRQKGSGRQRFFHLLKHFGVFFLCHLNKQIFQNTQIHGWMHANVWGKNGYSIVSLLLKKSKWKSCFVRFFTLQNRKDSNNLLLSESSLPARGRQNDLLCRTVDVALPSGK